MDEPIKKTQTQGKPQSGLVSGTKKIAKVIIGDQSHGGIISLVTGDRSVISLT